MGSTSQEFPERSKIINLLISSFQFAVFEEPEDPTNRSFFSEIISSISDVKFSNSGRYMISRDYLSVKVWDLHMETKPIETYTVRRSQKRVENELLHSRE